MSVLTRTLIAACFLFHGMLLADDAVIEQLPGFIEKGMSAWHVPGMAVTVVTDQDLLFQKGFGSTAADGGSAVDEHTLFAIASTTKAMVAAAIMMLVEEDKLALDDLAIDHLPELQFADAWLNSQVTVRDMLTHRTGLSSTDYWSFLQSTPLMEQIKRLRHVDPTASIRSRFQYQNTMFELLGLIIERLSGQAWEEFVSERIWSPLAMHETYASRGRIGEDKVHVMPYLYFNDSLSLTEWNLDPDLADAAGSVWSSVSDMGRWAQFLLRGGVTGDGQRLLSEAGIAELFKPQMLIEAGDFYPTTEITHPNWLSYGLGWFQQDFQGRKIDFHTGSLSGLIALIGLDREHNRAVVILGNRDHAEMRHAVLWQIMDQEPTETRRDWNEEVLALYTGREQKQKERWEKTVSERLPGTVASLPTQDFTGTYHNAAVGEVSIVQSETGMKLLTTNMYIMLSHWHLDTFLAEREDLDFKFLLPFSISPNGTVQSLKFAGQTFDKMDKATD